MAQPQCEKRHNQDFVMYASIIMSMYKHLRIMLALRMLGLTSIYLSVNVEISHFCHYLALFATINYEPVKGHSIDTNLRPQAQNIILKH